MKNFDDATVIECMTAVLKCDRIGPMAAIIAAEEIAKAARKAFERDRKFPRTDWDAVLANSVPLRDARDNGMVWDSVDVSDDDREPYTKPAGEVL